MTLEEDARRLVIDGERIAQASRDPPGRKAALQPQYELFLRALVRGERPRVARADDYLRVLCAMREEQAFAALAPDGDVAPSTFEAIATSPLRILAAYLARLPDTAVLAIERGAGVLTLFALRGGGEALAARIALERASKACVAAMIGLMQQLEDDTARVGRREPLTRAVFDGAEAAGAALWRALPGPIRDAIAGARTLLYLPSAFGDLSAFPLELLRAEDGWVGATRAVARLSSMRTLLALLSPARMPARLDARALVVRAGDSEELAAADLEAVAVRDALEQDLGLAAELDRAPQASAMRAALDRGMRVLHYCGHGFAGPLGESLPLSATEAVGPHDFSQLSGWGTPFVYLSTCELGRARLRATGSAVGIATRLIEKGAPELVGCLASVPDGVARAMAEAFYRAAAILPVGEALAAARAACGKYPPACWGAFACFGDPFLRLTAADGPVSQARHLTSRWDSLIGRHLVLRTDASRQQALAAVAAARGGGMADLLSAAAAWLEQSFRPAAPALRDERLALCLGVAHSDAVAGCELRMLLAMESLHGAYFGERRPDIVLAPEEAAVGLRCANAAGDLLACAAFAIEIARGGGIGYTPAQLLHLLEEAAGILDGWQLELPQATAMLATVRQLQAELG